MNGLFEIMFSLIVIFGVKAAHIEMWFTQIKAQKAVHK